MDKYFISGSKEFYIDSKNGSDKLCDNNGELKKVNDEGKSVPFNINDFKSLIGDTVSNFIDRYFDNIVVLIGAGASVILKEDSKDIDDEYGKTVGMIANDILNKLKNKKYTLNGEVVDVFGLEELSKKVKYKDEILNETQELNEKFNLEDLLSNLISYIKFADNSDKNKLKNTELAIFNIIKKDTSYEFISSKFNHGSLIKFLSSKLGENRKLNIITTNYDTLIEEAAESLDFTIFDGFTFSQKPKFDDDMFEWNLVKGVPNIKTNENIYKRNVINLLKIHGSLTWERESDDILRKNKSLVSKPLMIFPSSDKYMQSYEDPYFELFSRFQESLRKPNTLLITTGFSFADNHISRMIREAIIHNNSLYSLITDYDISNISSKGQDEGNADKNKEELYELMQNKYPIAFLKSTLNTDLLFYLGEK